MIHPSSKLTYFRRNWWLEDESSFLKKVPQRKDMWIFVGGYPYKWRKRSPLQEPTVAMEFTINRSPFAGKLKEITVFRKKKHDDQLDGYLWSFSSAKIWSLKMPGVVGFGVSLMSFIFFVKCQVVVFILVGGRPHSFSEWQTVKNCLRFSVHFFFIFFILGGGWTKRICQKETCWNKPKPSPKKNKKQVD